MTATAILSISVLLITQIQASWILELDLSKYSNPHHAMYSFNQNVFTCCDCPSKANCVADDANDLSTCTDRDCMNRFLICLADGVNQTCIYSQSTTSDSLEFSRGVTTGGISNPVQFTGENEGTITVTITVFDDVSDENSYIASFIDEIRIQIQFDPTDGINTHKTYTGMNGVITMTLGYGLHLVEDEECNCTSVTGTDATGIATTSTSLGSLVLICVTIFLLSLTALHLIP